MVGNVLKEREDYHRIYVDEEPSKKLKKDRKKMDSASPSVLGADDCNAHMGIE